MLSATGVWKAPAVDRNDLRIMADRVKDVIDAVDEDLLPDEPPIKVFVDAIDQVQAQVITQLWNSQTAAPAYVAYRAVLDAVRDYFSYYVNSTPDWEVLSDAGKLPKELTKRLRSIKSSIKELEEDYGDLKMKVGDINQAHEAALALPTDMDTLREAVARISHRREIAEKESVIVTASLEHVNKLLKSIQEKEAEAKQLVNNTHDAYSAATTKGLGEAFQSRGDELARSVWVWVVLLVIALGAGAVIGYYRFLALHDLVVERVSSDLLWLNVVMAALSLAAPVWFAWIATKQIGHRFRLAEDYSFKASVAKAYEGYRREAAKLDPAFAKRLFGSALDRIDEAPIRFVESETYGSPWHEWIGRKSTRARGSHKIGSHKPAEPVISEEQEMPGREIEARRDEV